MTPDEHFADKNCPAKIFLELWRIAAQMSPTERYSAPDPKDVLLRTLSRALATNEELASYGCLRALLNQPRSVNDQRGCVLAVMRELDRAFYQIHPRSQLQIELQKPVPKWLRVAAEDYIITGSYFADEAAFVIPRGPLQRLPRDEFAASADSLSDRFAALGVAPRFVSHEGRSVAVTSVYISNNPLLGVKSGGAVGAERIMLVPLAEQATDLACELRELDGNQYFHCQAGDGFEPADQFIAAIVQQGTAASEIDFVLAPEFVVGEKHADRIVAALSGNMLARPRLVVAGSGATSATDDGGLPWNEARILNGAGVELCRQRKLWPATVSSERATSYGLQDKGQTNYMEYSASGDTLNVLDIEGLGRCLILICQDMLMSSAVDEAIQLFQPDWVLSPVLDVGVTEGRWVHRRFFQLSALSQARYVAVSSLSLALKQDARSTPGCGLAVGPMAANYPDVDRSYTILSTTPSESPASITFDWQMSGATWKRSTLL